MAELHDQRRALLDLADSIPLGLSRIFTGSREGLEVVNIDEYNRTRDLIVQLHRVLNAEVHRVCFEERLSNRSCYGGE